MRLFPEALDFEAEEASKNLGKSFLFDFDKKQFVMEKGSPKTATKKESIQNWLELLIRTYLDSVDVYKGTGFGMEIKDLIGKRDVPIGFIESEIERELKEKINLNPAIEDLGYFDFKRYTNSILIEFSIILKNGEKVVVNYGR